MALARFPLAIFIIISVWLIQIPSSTVVDNGFVSAQQMYSEDYSEDCNNHHTGSSGYQCNGAAEECETFVLYRAQPLYMSLLNISMLFDTSPAVIASASNLSVKDYSKPLAKDQAVLIPIHCNCSGDFSQANITYTIKHSDTFINIANKTFEGLTTCQAMRTQNPNSNPFDLIIGMGIVAPLRCACPTDTQVSMGVKYLLSYIVYPGDYDDIITAKFNILYQDLMSANELLPLNHTIYPYTTLLIPLNHTPVVPPPVPLAPSPNNDIHCFNCSNAANGKRLSTKVTAGIVATICAVFTIVVVSCILFRRGISCKTASEEQHALHSRPPRTKRLLNEDYSMNMILDGTVSRAFTLEEMRAATENFSRKIGQGGFGSVFFGKLPEGKEIAIKVLSLFSKQGVHQFQNEVNLLSRVHHKNLVSLVGYCNDSTELMLIYEHMSGGSLRDCLYGGPRGGFSELNWKARLKIALDSAHGLEYLHVGCTPKIIHRDVKTANILLDSNMNGKLADFGLSRMTKDGEASHATTMVKGTIGYLDPEYFRTQMLTEKSDIYSFGVVLFEIICGRPPINANLGEEELNLIQWVTQYVKMDETPGEIAVIIDKRLGGNYELKSITGIAKLAMKCVEARPSSRPSVSEVVAGIKEAITLEGSAPLPDSEEIGIEYGDLQAYPVRSRADLSRPMDMKWDDNSSNLPQIGR